MRVLITGANGFIGKNLVVRLSEMGNIEVVPFTREENAGNLSELLENIDWIFHLAGINRSESSDEFIIDNLELSGLLCDAIGRSEKSIPVVFTSSIQAEGCSDYGRSKRAAEQKFLDFHKKILLASILCIDKC